MKIRNVFAYAIIAELLVISSGAVYMLWGYRPVTDIECLAYGGLMVGLIVLLMFAGQTRRLAEIEDKVDEIGKKVKGGN